MTVNTLSRRNIRHQFQGSSSPGQMVLEKCLPSPDGTFIICSDKASTLPDASAAIQTRTRDCTTRNASGDNQQSQPEGSTNQTKTSLPRKMTQSTRVQWLRIRSTTVVPLDYVRTLEDGSDPEVANTHFRESDLQKESGIANPGNCNHLHGEEEPGKAAVTTEGADTASASVWRGRLSGTKSGRRSTTRTMA